MEFLQVRQISAELYLSKITFDLHSFPTNVIHYGLILLQGRALLNAIGNLELSGSYAEALRKLGHNLEDVARQVR